jgi:hypothetical protein
MHAIAINATHINRIIVRPFEQHAPITPAPAQQHAPIKMGG